jgi:hypothetical protein
MWWVTFKESPMRTPDSGYVSSILAAAERPCVSIYLPTQRANGNGYYNQQNHAQYRALANRAGDILAKSYPAPVARGIVEKLSQFRDDEGFWGWVLEGAAVLASPERFDAFTLPRTVPEYVGVGESFHVKPLLRFVQSAEPFHVLGLSRERVALFHGNRYELHPLEVIGVPLTLTEALGSETEPTTWRFHTAGPGTAIRGGRGTHGAAISSGQGGWTDEIEIDTHRFFQTVDRKVIDLVSEPSGLPLIPAGVEENLAAFRAVTKNRFVSADAVTGDWTNWGLHEIREKAWKAFEKHYLKALAAIREDFGTAAARGKGTGDLAEAAKTAAVGRVGVLLIDADRTIPGTIDTASGILHPAPVSAANGDMLDDLAEMGMRTKAQVIVTPSAQMPTKTGLAAIYRY